MAKLIVHNPPTVKLKASGYTGTPTGDIELTENNRTYNVSPFATATTTIPEEEKTVTPSTTEQVITPDEGLLKKVTVNPTPLEVKTVTPSTEQQTILPQAPAIGFSQFTVNPVTPSIDPDIQPENIKQGVNILGVDGSLKPTPIPVEEKYINFIDYDGTVLYSWTEEELQEATELPPLPSHTGLNSVGWNWLLADIKLQGTPIYVGALYEPSDGKMEMIIRFYENDDFAVSLNLTYETQQTNVVIDWGDGSTEESHDSSISHIYSAKGDYEVKISSSSDKAVVLSSVSNISNRIIHVVLNNNVVVRTVLQSTYFLETLIISPSYRDNYFFQLSSGILYRLKAFILPNIITGTFTYTTCEKISIYGEIANYPNSMFRYSYIPYFVISHYVTSIPDNFFDTNGIISCIIIPKNIISIGVRSFRNNRMLMYIDLSDYNDPSNIPQLTDANAFENIASNAVFQFRNQEMLDAFSATTNWSTYADRFQIKGA